MAARRQPPAPKPAAPVTTSQAPIVEEQRADPPAVAAAPPPKPADDIVHSAAPGSEFTGEELTRAATANMLARRDSTMALAFQGLVPSSIGEAMQLAQHLARGMALPASSKGNPETVFTIIMAGMELGLTPIRALQNISNIKGNLCMKADLQLALVRRSGALDYYTEGFEFAWKTDYTEDAEGAADNRLERRLLAARCPDAENIAQQILDLTSDVPEGKPYGWAVARRKGDDQMHVRVFSWLDAERFIYNARDDEDGGGQGGGPKVERKLSEKSNYKNTPQDMYPKRARVRVLQVTHSDVSAGMPAIEAMDGFVIDAEVIQSEATSTEDVIDQLLQAMPADKAQTIRGGMDQLQMGIAKRMQKLREYQTRPDGLIDWLRTEYANRTNRGLGRRQADVLGATDRQEPATNQAPAETKSADRETNPADRESKPAETDTARQATADQSAAGNRVRDVAAAFKSTTF